MVQDPAHVPVRHSSRTPHWDPRCRIPFHLTDWFMKLVSEVSITKHDLRYGWGSRMDQHRFVSGLGQIGKAAGSN